MDFASLPKHPEQPGDVPRSGGLEAEFSVGRLLGDLWANAGLLWRVFVLFTSGVCYLLALGLPAAYHIWNPITGVDCLVSPVTETPFVLLWYPSWWANPVYVVGLFAFGLRKYGLAFVAGVVSLLLAAVYAVQVSNNAYNQRLYPGYWFWCAAMAALTVGGVVSFIRSCVADSRSEVAGGRCVEER